jgi:hypothetical protein
LGAARAARDADRPLDDERARAEKGVPMTRRHRLAAVCLALPLALAGCAGEGDVEVDAPNVEVTPGDVEVDVPDVDVDADVEDPEDSDGEAGADESPTP